MNKDLQHVDGITGINFCACVVASDTGTDLIARNRRTLGLEIIQVKKERRREFSEAAQPCAAQVDEPECDAAFRWIHVE